MIISLNPTHLDSRNVTSRRCWRLLQHQGIIHKEFVPQGTTVNSHYYLGVKQRVWAHASSETRRVWHKQLADVAAQRPVALRSKRETFLAKKAIKTIKDPPYSGCKITESFVTVRGEKTWKEQEGSAIVNSLSEHVYYNWKHLLLTAVLRCDTSAAWTCFTSYNTRKWLCFLFVCAIVFRSPPASHLSTSNGQWSSQLFCVHYTRPIWHQGLFFVFENQEGAGGSFRRH
jgi:hypothetical protein